MLVKHIKMKKSLLILQANECDDAILSPSKGHALMPFSTKFKKSFGNNIYAISPNMGQWNKISIYRLFEPTYRMYKLLMSV